MLWHAEKGNTTGRGAFNLAWRDRSVLLILYRLRRYFAHTDTKSRYLNRAEPVRSCKPDAGSRSIACPRVPDLDFAALTRDQTAALSEVSIENLGDGAKRVKFKLHDKQAALVSLGRQTAGPSAPILWVPPGTRS
jgi:hypothetical protein